MTLFDLNELLLGKDTSISCYKSKEESSGTPAHQMNLRGKESLGMTVLMVEYLLANIH